MKRFLFSSLLGLTLTQAVFGYENYGVVQVPPQNPALIQINDGNFYNAPGALFSIADFSPFQSSSVLNYTNLGTMIGSPGFDFEFYPQPQPQPQPGLLFNKRAANFMNLADGLGGGIISCSTECIVSATNLVNSGQIDISFGGLIKLSGTDIDLTRGSLTMPTVNQFFGNAGLDGYWGVGANTTSNLLNPSYLNTFPPTFSPSNPVITRNGFRTFAQLFLPNAQAYVFDSGVVGSNRIVQVVFLNNTNAAVTNLVFFNPQIGIAVQWQWQAVDYLTGGLSTNYMYLVDNFGERTNLSLVVNGRAGVNNTYRPVNYTFSTGAPFANASLASSQASSPLGVFNNRTVSNQWSAYQAIFTPSGQTMGDLAGQDVTNMAGRIEITADNTLDLTQTRISALEYLLLKATNHFIGNAGAVIQSPNYDMILRSTNGTLTSSNLIVPNLFSPLGIVNLDSERWVEVNAAGITNTYHVLFVDSQITPLSPLFAQTLSLKANNAANPEADSIFISDILNVTRSLYLDARSLTLTTNDGGAFTPVGQLNLLSSDIFWSTAAPRLRYLTNFGYITSGNLIYFAGNMTTPYDSRANATPYQTFVNHGWITNQGIFVYTKYFENSGVIEETPFGSIDLQTQCATITNGSLIAPAGHISLNAASLVISNSFIQSSAAMSLIVTNCLTDGYSLGNQFGQIVTSNTPANIVTNGNTWTVSGINLRANPSGDLLATTITNTAGFNNEVFNYWSGNDVGRTPAGFANNLALGRLILDGQTNSLFTFHGTGGNKAIYVDYLEFKDYTTNRNASGDFIGVNIGSDIKIYFAQAVMNGQSIADKLDGKNNGRFIWVTNYAGVYSSTNILYPDGNTYIFNRGLVESCLIDSDGDTIANCSDPTPIPTNWILTSVVSAPLCECIFSSQIENTAGGSPTSGSDNSSNAHRGKLLLPVHVTPSSGTVSFAAAKGIYNGLFYETNGVKSASSGYITVVTTPTGGYSAKLQRGAQLYSFSGQFNGTGYSTKTISGKGLPTLTIELDLSQEDQINGQVTSGGNWSSQLFAARVSSASNPAGKYTLLIQGDTENPQTTTGDGFGSVTINANGAVQWNGTLADGTKVTQKTALSKNGIWPFYSSLYSGAGSLIGWIQFTNRVGDDLNGTVLWILPPNSRAQYPAGFTNELEAVGSRLTGAFGFANGLNILSGGILDSVVTNHVVVSGNKLVSQNANLTISANPGSGLFKGSFFDSVSGQSILFQGALLEKSGFGTGFFLSPNQSGKVYLGSAPEPQP